MDEVCPFYEEFIDVTTKVTTLISSKETSTPLSQKRCNKLWSIFQYLSINDTNCKVQTLKHYLGSSLPVLFHQGFHRPVRGKLTGTKWLLADWIFSTMLLNVLHDRSTFISVTTRSNHWSHKQLPSEWTLKISWPCCFITSR